MTDLLAFLRCRIDEDDNGTAAAYPMLGQTSRLATMQGTTVLMSAARALAEVDAKRRIIAACQHHESPDTFDLIDDVLRLIALPYADHPDYQETWRP